MTTADEKTGGAFGEGPDDGPDLSPREVQDTGPDTHTVPQARRKLTGAELEARFDSWRARRDERAPEDGARTLRRGLGAVMGAGIVALVVVSALTGNSFGTDRAGNDARITALEKEVSQAQAVSEETDMSGRMTALTHAAAADAGQVAAAQQVYAQLHHDATTQPDTGNGAPNKAMLATAEHRRDLAPHFSERSYLADDDTAYVWQNVNPFGPDRIDPRFPWYVRYDGDKASTPDAYTWKTETVMPDLDFRDVPDRTDRARVVWLCRDTETGDALAWASAVYAYDGTKGVFDDLALVVTAAGAAHQHPSKRAQGAPEVPEISGLGTGGQDEGEGGDR
ncbi:hypothetical protein [Streptomyces sp. NPDC052042]|uniref:hypothetical protein n=1 Tax=Streptomyces sp. NPDC052042 TaxID=3365683 RepID=UPI0037CDE9E9